MKLHYLNLNKKNLDLPKDFDWKTYIFINDDLEKFCSTREQAESHYIHDGSKNKRMYKTINLPSDFDWECYLGLNYDVYNVCKSRTSAIMHYEKHGFYEDRIYKLEQTDIPVDFNWTTYIHTNSLDDKITNKIEAINHYYKVGQSENLSYQHIFKNVPKDFNWIVYCELNKDVQEICKNETDAMLHYDKDGHNQNRRYKIPEEELPDDFDWITYSELNTDVKVLYSGETLSKLHYIITGKKEGRIYKFVHVPENFDHKLYLELNDTISKEYKESEYTAKLHYDLFGYQQGLPYTENFQNVPADFDWKLYINFNPDIADICTSEIKAKAHYNNYGVYQSRVYNQHQKEKQKQSMMDYMLYPFLFHKYILNISKESKNIPYNIVQHSSLKEKTIKLVAHLHCFNIDKFALFYQNYIEKIKQYCQLIIITFSAGNVRSKNNEIFENNNIVIIQCENRGMDIGGKYVCLNYLQKKEVYYDSILFLHSKTDDQLRKLYWEPLLNNLNEIQNSLQEKTHIGIYVPPLIYMGDYACVIYKDHFAEPKNITCKWNFGNSLYLNDMERYHNLEKSNYIFPEGNCFVCKKKIADELFGNPKLYNLLNTTKTFDAVWVKSYYGLKKLKEMGPSIFDIYKFYRTTHHRPRLYANNIAWGQGHKGHPDNMYEHSFERIVFKIVQKLGYKVQVMPHIKDDTFINNLKIYNEKINDLL